MSWRLIIKNGWCYHHGSGTNHVCRRCFWFLHNRLYVPTGRLNNHAKFFRHSRKRYEQGMFVLDKFFYTFTAMNVVGKKNEERLALAKKRLAQFQRPSGAGLLSLPDETYGNTRGMFEKIIFNLLAQISYDNNNLARAFRQSVDGVSDKWFARNFHQRLWHRKRKWSHAHSLSGGKNDSFHTLESIRTLTSTQHF